MLAIRQGRQAVEGIERRAEAGEDVEVGAMASAHLGGDFAGEIGDPIDSASFIFQEGPLRGWWHRPFPDAAPVFPHVFRIPIPGIFLHIQIAFEIPGDQAKWAIGDQIGRASEVAFVFDGVRSVMVDERLCSRYSAGRTGAKRAQIGEIGHRMFQRNDEDIVTGSGDANGGKVRRLVGGVSFFIVLGRQRMQWKR